MTTWRDISIENELAAIALLKGKHWRSCISRAYYAVYAAVAGLLKDQGLSFGGGARDNPSHSNLPALVESNLSGLNQWQRRDLKSAARQLYSHRLDADYDDRATITMSLARQAVITMSTALAILRGGPA